MKFHGFMVKFKTLDSFYKRKTDGHDTTEITNPNNKRSKASTSEPLPEEHIPETRGPNSEEDDPNSLERDRAKRKQLSSYPVNQRAQVRLAYLNLGPFQIKLYKYPSKGPDKRPRRFQHSWFKIFPNWLEYSPTTHAAYCFLCYVFSDKPNVRHGSDAFTAKGFDNWKKVNDRKNCKFLKHLDEARDDSKKQQMAIVLRFVDKDGVIRERFLDLVHVSDTASLTKESLNDFRNNKWLCLLEEVKMFCEKYEIDMPDMQAPYKSGRYRPRRQDNHELNNRFNDHAMELLALASSLVPNKDSRAFNVDEICLLVAKYYREDFIEQERIHLRYQLEIFKVEMSKNQILSGVSSIAKLCTSLEETKKSETYHLLS
ncbi:hypothetical protein LXL04_006303 [Taraxacum kok-saghyz]